MIVRPDLKRPDDRHYCITLRVSKRSLKNRKISLFFEMKQSLKVTSTNPTFLFQVAMQYSRPQVSFTRIAKSTNVEKWNWRTTKFCLHNRIVACTVVWAICRLLMWVEFLSLLVKKALKTLKLRVESNKI